MKSFNSSSPLCLGFQRVQDDMGRRQHRMREEFETKSKIKSWMTKVTITLNASIG